MDTNDLIKRGMILGILVLFVGTGIIPGINGNVELASNVKGIDIYSNEIAKSDQIENIDTTDNEKSHGGDRDIIYG